MHRIAFCNTFKVFLASFVSIFGHKTHFVVVTSSIFVIFFKNKSLKTPLGIIFELRMNNTANKMKNSELYDIFSVFRTN